jgi:hypothetical protein
MRSGQDVVVNDATANTCVAASVKFDCKDKKARQDETGRKDNRR